MAVFFIITCHGCTDDKNNAILRLESELFEAKEFLEVNEKRIARQYNSEYLPIDLSEVMKIDGSSFLDDAVVDGTYFFVCFPSSACGVCHDEVLSLLVPLSRLEKMYFITDVQSKVDVQTYLKENGIAQQKLLLRKRNWEIPIEEGQGYPYFFLLSKTGETSTMYSTFIPDKHFLGHTKSYVDYVRRRINEL